MVPTVAAGVTAIKRDPQDAGLTSPTIRLMVRLA
jgi:hypothetical protein